jgi:hypothetical protein
MASRYCEGRLWSTIGRGRRRESLSTHEQRGYQREYWEARRREKNLRVIWGDWKSDSGEEQSDYGLTTKFMFFITNG